jgi:hypothetical protein
MSLDRTEDGQQSTVRSGPLWTCLASPELVGRHCRIELGAGPCGRAGRGRPLSPPSRTWHAAPAQTAVELGGWLRWKPGHPAHVGRRARGSRMLPSILRPSCVDLVCDFRAFVTGVRCSGSPGVAVHVDICVFHSTQRGLTGHCVVGHRVLAQRPVLPNACCPSFAHGPVRQQPRRLTDDRQHFGHAPRAYVLLAIATGVGEPPLNDRVASAHLAGHRNMLARRDSGETDVARSAISVQLATVISTQA